MRQANEAAGRLREALPAVRESILAGLTDEAMKDSPVDADRVADIRNEYRTAPRPYGEQGGCVVMHMNQMEDLFALIDHQAAVIAWMTRERG